MTHCIECGNPWGIILDRGEEPSPEGLAAAQAELVQLLLCECWYSYDEEDAENIARIDVSLLPSVRATEIIYITEALGRFADELGVGDAYLEDCWHEVEYVDLPKWLLKGRKRRWAYLWDCCNIGHDSIYFRKEILA